MNYGDEIQSDCLTVNVKNALEGEFRFVVSQLLHSTDAQFLKSGFDFLRQNKHFNKSTLFKLITLLPASPAHLGNFAIVYLKYVWVDVLIGRVSTEPDSLQEPDGKSVVI